MNDNKGDKLDGLFAAARSVRVDTSVCEEFFETRLMARLREKRNGTQVWFSWIWRLVPVFVIVIVALGSTSLILDRDSSADIFSAIANGHDEYQVVAYLEGD
jgi:hypothetical protein